MTNQTTTAAGHPVPRVIAAEMVDLQDKLAAAQRTSDYSSEAYYLERLIELRRQLRKVA